MNARELLMEAAPLDAVLRKGWVRIRYLRLDGVVRILTATTNPGLFTYVYRRAIQRPSPRRNILVWEHRLGWRALRRNRIMSWQPASLKKPIDPS